MNRDLATAAVEHGRELGAEYVEARIHHVRNLGALLRNGNPEPAVISDSYGIGIRLIYRGSLSFVATNNLRSDSVKGLVEDALRGAKSSQRILNDKIGFGKEKMSRSKWKAKEKKRLENYGVDVMIKFLKELDKLVKHEFKGVAFTNRLLSISSEIEDKTYVNSDGANLDSRVPRIEFSSYLASSYYGNIESFAIPPGYAQLGGTGGWEVLEDLNLHEYIQSKADDLSSVVKSTGKPPDGNVDIILGPGVTGLVAHESSGHPEEADRILGREAAQAGESYLKREDLGLKIGSDEAFVSDDPTLAGSMGFYLFDDEGVKAKKRRLIEAGYIREFLHNRDTGRELKTGSNASSRAVRYDREPIVRMANTFVEPGDHSFDELVEDVNHGVYIESFMEWNIDDKRLNQRYVGLEAYVIENGKVSRRIRNPILEITTPKFWSSVDARGNDLQFTAATCGKGDPMQGSPVWTGGPHIRLRGLRVGSR